MKKYTYPNAVIYISVHTDFKRIQMATERFMKKVIAEKQGEDNLWDRRYVQNYL